MIFFDPTGKRWSRIKRSSGLLISTGGILTALTVGGALLYQPSWSPLPFHSPLKQSPTSTLQTTSKVHSKTIASLFRRHTATTLATNTSSTVASTSAASSSSIVHPTSTVAGTSSSTVSTQTTTTHGNSTTARSQKTTRSL